MSKVLWTLRESRELSAELWRAFKEQAAAQGHSPTTALSRILRRYIQHGFDDGAPERLESSGPENKSR